MIKILIDINLPPVWAQVLSEQGWDAVHWSAVGDPRAPDDVVLTWARDNQYVVFTHDLDFGVHPVGINTRQRTECRTGPDA